MSLKKKTISGLIWSGISQGGKQISQLIITTILARLLSPTDFGLLAMATVFTNFANTFSELGTGSALIQKQDIDERHLSSTFWLNICGGSALTLLIIMASPVIAKFFNKPVLQPILAIMSLNYLLTSFTIVQQTLLTKEMDFRKLAIRDILSVIIAGMVGIYFAYKGYGVWSLVYQLLTYTLVNNILLWTVSKWRPKFIFSKEAIKDIFNFSANLTGFNIVNYFARNIDQLLIGKILGAQALGYYSLAYKIMLYPIQTISGVINRVMFPAFSKIQNDLEKIQGTYLKMVKAISLITFPMTLILFSVTPEFVKVILGPHWKPAIPLIMILCFCSLVQSVGGPIVGNIRLSQGKTDMHLQIGIANSFMVVIVVLLGIKWGVVGVAFFYTIYSFIWFLVTNAVTLPLIKLKLSTFLLSLRQSIVIGTLTALVVYLTRGLLLIGSISERITLIASLSVGVFAYVFILEKMNLILLKKKKIIFIQ